MFEEAFFSGGVPLWRLQEWLGAPLDSRYEQTISATVRVVVGGVAREVEPSNNEIVAWDCLRYEKTFRAIHEAASDAPQSQRDFVFRALATSSQMHVLTQCRAERVGYDLWIMRLLCLKHICETAL
jgi:hypothetical protein